MFFSIYTCYVVAFYVNIFRLIYQYFDYSVLEKNAPIKKSKTVEC